MSRVFSTSLDQAEPAPVVHGLVLQQPLHELTSAETRRIRQVFGHAPLEANLGAVRT
ncbi:hypothetical protein [Nocardioides gansuensis]|uniref:hypothetical protein n=1 Tax=Nocardioides gansuensis TaxID=2138300 RepID=UPI001402C94C|nr:hypothetical protein [Nocardioides gansuensis]